MLKEILADLTEFFSGDLDDNDIMLIVRSKDKDGKEFDKITLVLPDPLVDAVVECLENDDMNSLPTKILEKSFDPETDKMVLISTSPEHGLYGRFSPGRLVSRALYRYLRKTFRTGA